MLLLTVFWRCFEVLGVATPRVIEIHCIQCIWWPWDSPLSHSWPRVLRFTGFTYLTWPWHVTWHHVGLRYWRGPRSVNLERCHQVISLLYAIWQKFKDQIMIIQIQKALLIQSASASILHFSGHSRCPGGLLIDEFSAIRSSRFESIFCGKKLIRSPSKSMSFCGWNKNSWIYHDFHHGPDATQHGTEASSRYEWDGLPYKRMASG